MKRIISILLLSMLSFVMAGEIDLSQFKGINQEIIESFSPEPTGVLSKRKANINIFFNEKLKEASTRNSIKLRYLGCQEAKKEKLQTRLTKNLQNCETRYLDNKRLRKACQRCYKHIYKYQIKRKCKPKKVHGITQYNAQKNRLRFNPKQKLKFGYYEVRVKGLKTEKNQKLEKIVYRFELSKNSLESIRLTSSEITLNKSKNETAQLKLQALYKDGTSEGVNEGINWVIGDETLFSISKDGNITALKQGETLVQAEYGGKVSEQVKVTIVEEINGHRLPPEPDEVENNATLGGVDVNKNGVRDDVERKIRQKYKKPLQSANLMQRAKFYQQTLVKPTSDAIEIQKDVTRAINCTMYLRQYDQEIGRISWMEQTKYIKDLTFNNINRVEKYWKYNVALSGGSYGSSFEDDTIDKCSQEIIDVVEGMK